MKIVHFRPEQKQQIKNKIHKKDCSTAQRKKKQKTSEFNERTEYIMKTTTMHALLPTVSQSVVVFPLAAPTTVPFSLLTFSILYILLCV